MGVSTAVASEVDVNKNNVNEAIIMSPITSTTESFTMKETACHPEIWVPVMLPMAEDERLLIDCQTMKRWVKMLKTLSFLGGGRTLHNPVGSTHTRYVCDAVTDGDITDRIAWVQLRSRTQTRKKHGHRASKHYCWFFCSYLDVLNACFTWPSCLMKTQEEDEKRESKQMLSPPIMNLGGRIFTLSNSIFGFIQLLFQGWFCGWIATTTRGTRCCGTCCGTGCRCCASNSRLLYLLLLMLLRISSRLMSSCGRRRSSHFWWTVNLKATL